MKTLAALLMTTTAAFAGSMTQNITGCETVAVEGSNYTVRVDPHCALSTDLPDGDSLVATLIRARAAVAAEE